MDINVASSEESSAYVPTGSVEEIIETPELSVELDTLTLSVSVKDHPEFTASATEDKDYNYITVTVSAPEGKGFPDPIKVFLNGTDITDSCSFSTDRAVFTFKTKDPNWSEII